MPTPKLHTADIESTVRRFIGENYQYREGGRSLGDTDSFLEHGIMDSMGVLELVTFLQTSFNIRIADDEILPENLDSVVQIAAYIRRKTDQNVGACHAG